MTDTQFTPTTGKITGRGLVQGFGKRDQFVAHIIEMATDTQEVAGYMLIIVDTAAGAVFSIGEKNFVDGEQVCRIFESLETAKEYLINIVELVERAINPHFLHTPQARANRAVAREYLRHLEVDAYTQKTARLE